MEVMSNSVTGRLLIPLWELLLGLYRESLLARLFFGVAEWWKGHWRRSPIADFITREGRVSRAWPKSAACGLLSLLLNLPAALLHALYLRLRPVFDGSFFASLAFGIGEQTPAAIGWLMLAVLAIPYKNWNNTYSLMGFALMAALTVVGGMRRRSLRMDAVALGPWLICFFAAAALAWPLSYSSHLSFRFLFFHLTCLLCVLVTVSTVERGRDLLRLTGFASEALAISAVVGFAQRLMGVEVNASFVDLTLELNKDMPGRVFGVFENPKAFSQVLVMLIPLAVALMLGSEGWRGRIGGAVAAIFGTGALLMTYSRAEWIGLAAAALLFVFLWNRKLLPAIIVLGLGALPLLPASIFNRILTMFVGTDSSVTSRFSLYDAALNLLKARPVTGAGLGTDAVRKAVADLNFYHGEAPFVHAHNIYLQVWAETGLLGIVSFLGAMLWTIKKGMRAVAGKTCPRAVRMVTIGGVSALAGVMVCGLADYIWNYPRVMLVFWFVVAVTLSGVRLAARADRQ